MVLVSFKPKIPENYKTFSSASESDKQNLWDRTSDLLFFFLYKHIICLQNHISLVQRKSLPYLFRGNCCGHVVLI